MADASTLAFIGIGIPYDFNRDLLPLGDNSANTALYGPPGALEYGVVSVGDGRNRLPCGAISVGQKSFWFFT